jgi:aspartokinase
VSRVEVRDGFAQAIVDQLASPIGPARIAVLEAIALAGVSIDFLKLAPSGMSFLVPEDRAKAADSALADSGCRYRLESPRSIVMVHAVNMRDEEGLIARIVSTAIGSGLTLEHLGDMHDRMLIVLESGDARKLAEVVERSLKGVSP